MSGRVRILSGYEKGDISMKLIEHMFLSVRIALFGLSFSRDGQVFLCTNNEMKTVRGLWAKKTIQPFDIANNFDGTHSVAFASIEEAEAAEKTFATHGLHKDLR